ncbi:MAG: hypothetical protein L0215_01015 [Gemmataceae bacterium]|nr:hypothetical protein [Gemmataceae bacterium]
METARWVVIAAAIVLSVGWIGVAIVKRPRPTPAPDDIVLRYGFTIRFLGVLSALGAPLCMILLMVLAPLPRPRDAYWAGGILFCLGCLGGILLLEIAGVRLTFNAQRVLSISPWRQQLEWRWEEIEQVSFSRLNRWLVLKGPGGKKVRASIYLLRIRDLVQAVKQHIPDKKREQAKSYLDNPTKHW